MLQIKSIIVDCSKAKQQLEQGGADLVNLVFSFTDNSGVRI